MGSYFSCDRCDFSPGDRIGKYYDVDKILGEGSFGRVYKVRDVRDGDIYALKLLKLWEVLSSARHSLLKRFDMEYQTGLIESNYLVRAVSSGVVQGNPFIVMEYCTGGDLTAKIGQVESAQLVKVSSDVLYGLADLHRHGKVHRDLKPENVLLKSDGRALLTDFGISGDQNKRLTEKGIMGIPKDRFGTFAYMPPEQVNPPRGNATVLPTTDIFSFGVMTYQLLTGSLPFGELMTEADLPRYVERGNRGRWDRKTLELNQKAKSWVPLIEGCLEPNYKNRLQNVDEVLRLLPRDYNISSYKQSGIELSYNKEQTWGIILRVMQGEEYGREYVLNMVLKQFYHHFNRGIISVGRKDRDVNNNINIVETDTCFTSRHHCTLEKDEATQHWFVRDGQWIDGRWKRSLNGTFVNSTEVSEAGYYIQPGDIITIGDVKLRVEGATKDWWKDRRWT